ncbi:MAG: protein-export chaperone SecB [Pseudomonadota bacterium]
MADTNTDAAAGAAATPVLPTMKILGQYIRDMSFENILAQKPIEGEVKPDVQVQVGLDAKKRPTDKQYEVTTKFSITSKNTTGGQTIYSLEIEYAGIFQIDNVTEEQLHPFLMIECPRMIFPFVRRIVSDVTRDGGFPPLALDTIDFIALYRQNLAQRQAAQAAEAAKPN